MVGLIGSFSIQMGLIGIVSIESVVSLVPEDYPTAMSDFYKSTGRVGLIGIIGGFNMYS
jgi:hypothetical protein